MAYLPAPYEAPMMIDMCGIVEQLTADTINAPRLMMPACSALEPTMKPVTLWRKRIGTRLQDYEI